MINYRTMSKRILAGCDLNKEIATSCLGNKTNVLLTDSDFTLPKLLFDDTVKYVFLISSTRQKLLKRIACYACLYNCSISNKALCGVVSNTTRLVVIHYFDNTYYAFAHFGCLEVLLGS